MPTNLPPIDKTNPYLRAVYDEFRDRRFRDDPTLDRHRFKFKQTLRKGNCKPFVRHLVRDVLTGRWKIGSSQTELAFWLGLEDSSGISTAQRWGTISTEILIQLLTCPTRPVDWDPNLDDKLDLASEMDRNAFIYAVAYSAYGVDQKGNDSRFSELDYELFCGLLKRLRDWTVANGRDVQQSIATEIVKAVVKSDADYLLRPWYTKDERISLNRSLHLLQDDSAHALDYLRSLQCNWEGPFIFTWWERDEVNW